MDYEFVLTAMMAILSFMFAAMGVMLRKMRKKLQTDSSQHKLLLFDIKRVIRGKR